MTSPPTPSASIRASAGFSPSRLGRVSAVLRADIDSAAVPGVVVLIMRDGKPAYFEAFGYADRKTRRPMQLDSVFRIASMTKPLTVVAALMLMEQGKLLLTDAVSRFVPALRDVKVGVEKLDASGQRSLTLGPQRCAMTVHDLMRHTAGFTYGLVGDSLVQRIYRAAHLMDGQQSNADMIAKLAELPLSHHPGTTFEYGMSTDVLGHVVEIVAGMNLACFFAEYITGPLGMPDTAFAIQPQERHRLAEPQCGAAAIDPALFPYDPAEPATQWFSGGGGLLATAADYARFTQMLLNQGELDGVRLLARKTVQLMVQNHLPATLSYGLQTAELGASAPLPHLGQGYGLGLGVRTAAGLSPMPGSVGDFYWGGASGPYFWADPVEKMSVVFMLQELDMQIRTRYRPLLRGLVYQALS